MDFRRLAVSIAESAGWLSFVRADIVQSYLQGKNPDLRHNGATPALRRQSDTESDSFRHRLCG